MNFVGGSSRVRRQWGRRRQYRGNSMWQALSELLLDQPLDMVGFVFRVVLVLIIAVMSMPMLFAAMGPDVIGWFWHSVNLPFHEAGHVLFSFGPPIMVSFMGSGMQLLVPLVCGTALLFKARDRVGAALCLWWFGLNFLDIAPYIADARAGVLPLLGGNIGKESPYGFHDWEFILGEVGLLSLDTAIAKACWNIGKGVMSLALLWAAAVLFRARHNISPHV